MGFRYQRRVPITRDRQTWANVSKSGVSASTRKGRVTVNSKGRVSVRLFKGLSWRGKI